MTAICFLKKAGQKLVMCFCIFIKFPRILATTIIGPGQKRGGCQNRTHLGGLLQQMTAIISPILTCVYVCYVVLEPPTLAKLLLQGLRCSFPFHTHTHDTCGKYFAYKSAF